MQFLQNIHLIQGGMGVYVSNWRLARAVASARQNISSKAWITAGTISGTALDIVYVRLLQLGDPGGHIRRALAAFDAQFGIEIGKKIIGRYYIEGGKAPSARFRPAPLHAVKTKDGGKIIIPPSQSITSLDLILEEDTVELLIASAFAETWLAKQEQDGLIFINFLNKIELPMVYAMYGAMLAGVDGIVVGAGNPDGLPAICSHLTRHEAIRRELSVLYRETDENFFLCFDPMHIADGKLAANPLKRPAFLAIVSSETLVKALAESPNGAPDGFIIEHHTAGGHNAPPQGPLKLDERQQPVYSSLDEPDLKVIRQAGLPFWLAGGYGSREKLAWAQAAGAAGVQAGTIFALCEESGMKSTYRNAILESLKKGKTDTELVQTTMFSPTGFPFKAAQIDGTLSEDIVYSARKRVCDLGVLQQRGLSKPAENGTRTMFQRCSAAPLEDFFHKRGLPRNAEGRRCLCNGLIAAAGLGQVYADYQEPAIITLGNHLDGVRRLSRNGQSPYWAQDAIDDILG